MRVSASYRQTTNALKWQSSGLWISPYLALLLPGAHRLEQALDLHLMLHCLFVSITEKVLQHPFLPLQTLAQLLGYLTLPRSEFAEQCCTEILRQKKQRKWWRKESPLLRIEGLIRIYHRRRGCDILMSKYPILFSFVCWIYLAQAWHTQGCKYVLSEWTLTYRKYWWWQLTDCFLK